MTTSGITGDPQPICVETANAALVFYVDGEGRLFQGAFGAKGADLVQGQLAFPVAGDGWIFEPALRVTHADGNTSTDLRVIASETEGPVTRISLKDPEYPLFVDLLFRTSPDEDVFEAWTEVRHSESGEVRLDRFASSSPDFGGGDFYLTQFHGDWADEMNIQEEPLGFGIKILDSKLGVRAHQFRNPSFLLSKGGPAMEDSGEVFGGSLAWSGSFQFAFERLPDGRLRGLCGMNPYASEYHLEPGEKFVTPRMVWGWSASGTGALSRNLHRWTRKNALRDGDRSRAILLNNWEATYFSFDSEKIVSLFDGAVALGMELFLLDDGWFGRKYPRDDDSQGLGDWTPDPKKLPDGIGELTQKAQEKGIRFGIWLEPEMVNPRSELYENHPDWVVRQPKRPPELQRNQLVLDLANPEVEEYVCSLVDRTLSENPGISYVKWDCNRYLTQPGSPYLGKERQTHLQIEYVWALYRVMDRLAKSHPDVEVMMCSGGGARVDYASLRYAQEYWPSDMTDPARRIFIQWGYSFFFPAIATSNHVTLAGGHGMKFAFDVAMSGRLGMDVDVDNLSAEDREFATQAIATYKEVRDVVQLGDQYRLESPYAGPRSSLMYVLRDRAVLFVYSLGESAAAPLRLKGLDPSHRYRVQEINPPKGATGLTTTVDGSTLMGEGLGVMALSQFGSLVFELRAEELAP
ncbi:alpha-galactosidase [Fimbriimonas ginsengisoli]|uniref:Alpha-galactosidase n=1 Tax=Fimbriimonas ginsengisoli Gsoil 348 TaxID=661478 RepID=A0A068NJE8_FIMGI|nr:alpha-galactosidase [Fimbriimonas ginsengisoli]AIE83743.1 glycoside hydrolase clan GH-D [Fimbriimonas ginsengisoli Gsoil 348]